MGQYRCTATIHEEGSPGAVMRPTARPGDIRIRGIRPDDWRRLQRFHDRLSPSTVSLRFHGGKKHLSEPLARRFADLDGVHEVALVATTGSWGRIVGVARYSRVSEDAAEVAFVVEDAYQHHHLGLHLMERLKALACAKGIHTFIADVTPTNLPMLRLLEAAGPTEFQHDAVGTRVTVDLDPGRISSNGASVP
ncbi:MAG TPA: GNAT family N-acetyltransferase [Chloroflexota bacterium]|nr:GNAT family N-acetyltransferase [Chloroflexota bacterium]